MRDTLLIFGSSRADGNTMQAVREVINGYPVDIINLLEKSIGHYDYRHKNWDDDFLPIAGRMTQADRIIFATPVYWYAMSALLKTFFDRFTDLITVRKDLGRAMKGRECYLIACGATRKLPEGFEVPFAATCEYLDMEYKACFYALAEGEDRIAEQSRKDAKAFAKRLFGE